MHEGEIVFKELHPFDPHSIKEMHSKSFQAVVEYVKKARQMNSHTIVYLDQNYLSNMAKARIGSIEDEDQAKFWYSLFNDLKKAVLTDKIACPESEFQRHEASYDRRLEGPIRKVIDELSWGLKFHTSTTIMESQIYDAAKRFLSREVEERESWTKAFRTNPHAAAESRMIDLLGAKGRINVHISYPDEIIKHDRRLKAEFANDKILPVKYQSNYSDWSELLRREKISLICSISGLSILDSDYQLWLEQKRRDYPQIDKFIVNERIADIERFYKRLSEIGIDTANTTMVADFLISEELLSIPYIDIFSSINAVKIMHYPNRKRRHSDFYDIPVLATILPYCDIVTTDIFMKEILIKRLNFDDKYNVKIFSATKADRLAFQKLVRTLI